MAEQNLSNFAAFDLDDLLAEINNSNQSKKEVTAYLDRSFIVNMIKQYRDEALVNKPDFTIDTRMDLTDYNFTGADLRGFKRKDLELFKFNDCDITQTRLDRIALDYFREYMKDGKIIFQGINLEDAYLGPVLSKRIELGIECYVYLNLSNLNLSGTSFKNSDINGLILENTNISGCDFTNVKNFDARQFAFSIGFESAIFSNIKEEEQTIKTKIMQYSETLDPNYNNIAYKTNKLMTFLMNITRTLDG